LSFRLSAKDRYVVGGDEFPEEEWEYGSWTFIDNQVYNGVIMQFRGCRTMGSDWRERGQNRRFVCCCKFKKVIKVRLLKDI